MVTLPFFPLFHLQLKRLFRALPAWHTDKGQFPVDDRRWYGPYRMAIRQFLSVLGGDIYFPVGKAVLDPQLLPEALR